MEKIYIITEKGFGIEVQISEQELATLKERLANGDSIAGVEIVE